MKTNQLIFIVSIVFNFTASAQQSLVVSGGNASGVGGTMSYSVGQIAYTTNDANGAGSLSQGVQQPFEIQTVLGIEIPEINLVILAYPNPTTSMLTLDIGDFDYRKTTMQLFDINGRILLNTKIIESKTTVVMDRYPQATYLLNVLNNNKIIKTFKILKNQ